MGLEALKVCCKKDGVADSEAVKLHNAGADSEMVERAQTLGVGIRDIISLIDQYGPVAAQIINRFLEFLKPFAKDKHQEPMAAKKEPKKEV